MLATLFGGTKDFVLVPQCTATNENALMPDAEGKAFVIGLDGATFNARERPASDGTERLAAGLVVTPNVRLLSPLGTGGMGAVWLADHAGLKTKVVVKFMLGRNPRRSARRRQRRVTFPRTAFLRARRIQSPYFDRSV